MQGDQDSRSATPVPLTSPLMDLDDDDDNNNTLLPPADGDASTYHFRLEVMVFTLMI